MKKIVCMLLAKKIFALFIALCFVIPSALADGSVPIRLGSNITVQEKRQALRLTQEKVAEKAEKSLRLITDIERGAVGMSIETLLAMCDVLKTTPNNLLLSGEKAQDTELEWLVDALTNASEHVRASAIDIVRSCLRSTSCGRNLSAKLTKCKDILHFPRPFLMVVE